MSQALTTGRCATLVNQALDCPGAFSAGFFRGEVLDGRLTARVHTKGSRARARIRIHPRDFVAYLRQHVPNAADRVSTMLSVAA